VVVVRRRGDGGGGSALTTMLRLPLAPADAPPNRDLGGVLTQPGLPRAGARRRVAGRIFLLKCGENRQAAIGE